MNLVNVLNIMIVTIVCIVTKNAFQEKKKKFVDCKNVVNVGLLRMYELTNICKDHLTKKYFLPLNVVNLVNLKNIDYFEGREKLLMVIL